MAKKNDTFEMLDTSPDKGYRVKWIGLGLAAVVLVGAILAYFFMDREPATKEVATSPINEQPVPETPSSTESTPTVLPEPVPSPPFEESVHFAFDQAEVLVSEISRLEAFWSKIMGRVGNLTINGHADAIGPKSFNQELSIKRAEEVARRLKGLGMGEGYEVTIQGFGETQPVADDSTEAGRAQNRRVELSFVAKN